MEAIFRVDASPLIGAGHLIRCLALAGELRKRGCECLFLMHADQAGSLARQVIREGHQLLALPERPVGAQATAGDSPPSTHSDWLRGGWESDARACGQVLDGRSPADWLVVDHYALDERFESAMSPYARAAFVIDDLADRRHECAYLLDQSFLPAMDDRYAELVPGGCRRLFGPRYALLRPAFAELRGKRANRDGIIRRVLVCFGGFDAGGHTAAALEALRPYGTRLDAIDVVLGEDSLHRSRVQQLSSRMENATVHAPAPDMASLLQKADLAIGGGGTMTWERACLGVPTLAVAVAGNQRPGLAALLQAGYLVGSSSNLDVDSAAIAYWLGSLFQSPELVQGLSQRSASLVDGLGAQRVAAMLVPDTLRFREATAEDTDRLLQWRNDPAVRAASANSTCIDAETHRTWLTRTLADPQRALLIAEHALGPVGVVRFDFSPPQAVISVYRVPRSPAAGLVRQATMWLAKNHPEIRKVRAEVLAGNEVSMAAFRNAGYSLEKEVLVWERHD